MGIAARRPTRIIPGGLLAWWGSWLWSYQPTVLYGLRTCRRWFRGDSTWREVEFTRVVRDRGGPSRAQRTTSRPHRFSGRLFLPPREVRTSLETGRGRHAPRRAGQFG